MPDHIHGIIEMVGACTGTGLEPAPARHPLSEIIRGFKTFSARAINKVNPEGFFRWQRSFFDRIIRNSHEYAAVTEYIRQNPARWEAGTRTDWPDDEYDRAGAGAGTGRARV